MNVKMMSLKFRLKVVKHINKSVFWNQTQLQPRKDGQSHHHNNSIILTTNTDSHIKNKNKKKNTFNPAQLRDKNATHL